MRKYFLIIACVLFKIQFVFSAQAELDCNQVKIGKYEIAHAYHGTSVTLEQLEDILTNSIYGQYPEYNAIGAECGLITTKGGRIGDGVYLASDKNVAESIAYHRLAQRPGTAKVVLQYFINLPQGFKSKACMCNPFAPSVNDNKHCFADSKESVDVIKAWHPPWIADTVLREICVRNPKHLVLRGIYVANDHAINPKVLRGYLQDSRLSIDNQGNLNLNGSPLGSPLSLREKEMRHLSDWWKSLYENPPLGGNNTLF